MLASPLASVKTQTQWKPVGSGLDTAEESKHDFLSVHGNQPWLRKLWGSVCGIEPSGTQSSPRERDHHRGLCYWSFHRNTEISVRAVETYDICYGSLN